MLPIWELGPDCTHPPKRRVIYSGVAGIFLRGDKVTFPIFFLVDTKQISSYFKKWKAKKKKKGGVLCSFFVPFPFLPFQIFTFPLPFYNFPSFSLHFPFFPIGRQKFPGEKCQGPLCPPAPTFYASGDIIIIVIIRNIYRAQYTKSSKRWFKYWTKPWGKILEKTSNTEVANLTFRPPVRNPSIMPIVWTWLCSCFHTLMCRHHTMPKIWQSYWWLKLFVFRQQLGMLTMPTTGEIHSISKLRSWVYCAWAFGGQIVLLLKAYSLISYRGRS